VIEEIGKDVGGRNEMRKYCIQKRVEAEE